MTTLILPVAGQSSRFPGMRPKWLLTMPCGALMIEKSVSKLDMKCFGRIVIVCLAEHIKKFVDFQKLKARINSSLSVNVDWVVLEQGTSSQSETIIAAIEKAEISGPIYIKDCDNEFCSEITGDNQISVIDLNSVDLIDAKNKSYVQTNELYDVINIVEKRVISNFFCCGGYGFEDAATFQSHFRRVAHSSSNEIYVSHVIYDMIASGVNFVATEASNYVDWGTKSEYLSYTQHFITVFCDLDGVLFENGSAFGKTGWDTDPIHQNITALKKLKDAGRLHLIITTSRPEAERERTIDSLKKMGLEPDGAIFDLPHSRRYLVNDFANTNPYPSALAINLERNSTKLESLFSLI